MDYGRIARIAVPAVAVGAGAAAAAPWIADLVDGDPAPATSAPPPSQAASGADAVTPTTVPTVAIEPAAPARRTYANPVFADDAPDPAIVRGDDGLFYAFTTETAFLPFQVLRSPDLTSWERVGSAFEGTGPAWIAEHRWAPDVQKTGDHFTMRCRAVASPAPGTVRSSRTMPATTGCSTTHGAPIQQRAACSCSSRSTGRAAGRWSAAAPRRSPPWTRR